MRKKEGKYKGRKKILYSDFRSFDRLYAMYMRHEISKSEIAKELEVSRPTVDRMMQEYKMENNVCQTIEK